MQLAQSAHAIQVCYGIPRVSLWGCGSPSSLASPGLAFIYFYFSFLCVVSHAQVSGSCAACAVMVAMMTLVTAGARWCRLPQPLVRYMLKCFIYYIFNTSYWHSASCSLRVEVPVAERPRPLTRHPTIVAKVQYMDSATARHVPGCSRPASSRGPGRFRVRPAAAVHAACVSPSCGSGGRRRAWLLLVLYSKLENIHTINFA